MFILYEEIDNNLNDKRYLKLEIFSFNSIRFQVNIKTTFTSFIGRVHPRMKDHTTVVFVVDFHTTLVANQIIHRKQIKNILESVYFY